MTLRDFLIGFCCFSAGQIVTIIYYCLFTVDKCSRCDNERYQFTHTQGGQSHADAETNS